MTSTLIHAPHPIPYDAWSPRVPRPVVFLAGSIEMGSAPDWQTEVAAALSDLPVTVLNPRRPDWDSSWVQSIKDARFREQVTWELDGLSRADLVLFYLAPGTVSPISLMELGLHMVDKDLLVCCPEGFARRGNVEVVLDWHGADPVIETLPILIETARARLIWRIRELGVNRLT